jgi:hypothetical protein
MMPMCIEAKRELVQIRVQMGRCNRTLMRPQQPTLQQGCHLMNARHSDMRRIARMRTSLPGSTAYSTKGIRLAEETSATRRRRTRPKPLGSSSSISSGLIPRRLRRSLHLALF